MREPFKLFSGASQRPSFLRELSELVGDYDKSTSSVSWNPHDPGGSAPVSAPPAPVKLAGKLPPRPGAPASQISVDEDPPAATEVAPQLFFGSVDEFVREKLRYTYARRVGPQGPNRWAAEWWRSAEAISRLDALWRAWEALRLEGTFGMSMWWRDHADHHMRMLMSPEGPFADSRDLNGQGEPLPYSAPPPGMFVDVRNLPG